MLHSLRTRMALSALLLSIVTFAASPQEAPSGASSKSAEGLRYEIAEWKLAVGDSPEMAGADYDDSAWESVKLPAVLKPGKSLAVYWLRTSFALPEAAPERLWFLTRNDGAALELYVDGKYCGSRGSLPPDYDLRATRCAAILLPADSAKPGATVTIALRCSFKGSSVNQQAYQVGDSAARDFELDARNFWNGQLYEILAALCFFLGLFSLAKFAFKTTERHELFFAMTLLFSGFYLLELGAEFWVFRAPWSRALARSSLILSMMFLLPFFTTFFGFFQKKAVTIASVGVGLAFTTAFIANSADDAAIQGVFVLSLAPVLVVILLCGYMSLKAIRAGSREAWPVLIAVVAGIALAAYDSYYTVIGKVPFAWLEGIAFFMLNVSIFIAQSMRQAKLKTDLEAYAREVESKKSELGKSLAAIGEAGRAAAGIAERLDEAATRAAEAARDSARRSTGISADTERQAQEAKAADELVASLVSSIGKVNESLGSQNESAERTAAAATELSAAAEAVALSVGHAAEFTNGLAALTESGDKAASSLKATMDKVSAASKGIAEVVDAVNEFAERTNLLAMNAAIEAAHSGQSGRGFAVIAGEVKGLAAAQTERAARIKVIVKEIEQRVSEGGADAARLTQTIRQIASGSAEAALKLQEVTRATEEQTRASGEISSSMESLVVAISAIHDEAERQAEFSAKVRSAVAAIVEDADQARSAARSIAEDGAGLAQSVEGLKELAAKGERLTAALTGRDGATG